MKMRGSIPARKPKMTIEELREQKRINREKKQAANADKQNREQGSVDQWITPGILYSAGQPIPDEVPQPEGDESGG